MAATKWPALLARPIKSVKSPRGKIVRRDGRGVKYVRLANVTSGRYHQLVRRRESMLVRGIWSLFALALVAAPLAAQHHSGGSHRSGPSYHPRSHYSHPRSAIPGPRAAAPRARGGSTHPRSPSTHPRSYSVRPPAAPGGSHGSSGRIHRSRAAKDDFMRQSGHSRGWPGHVVDHIVPLACGGADAPTNMQWQTTEEAQAKDKVERKGCSTR